MACAASLPDDFSSRFSVAECAWTSCAACSVLWVSGSGTGTSLPYPDGCARRRVGTGALGRARDGYRGARDGRQARRAALPGRSPAAGIETRHAFSFGPHYDPENLRFGAVLACNEERLAPGAGFDEHPHSHTEIVTWVIEGELTHRDSTGHETTVRPGDVQRLSAAAGVRHVERNDGAVPLAFVQMWLAPRAPGGDPSYEIVRGIADSTPYAVPEAGAMLYVRRLGAGERTAVPDGAYGYVHVVRGEVRLGEETLGPGDSARITGAEGLEAVGVTPVELLVWEMGAG
ncbi:redox-sensitive bicupin YhaK (pirin superfamily) [Streptomyces sp. V3I7]|nr:redox-sensitive bicupin YhaK (pirin superfamily) [Streptomyces sp. V3I7]